MNQIQRDFTYRLDAVRSVCEQHSYESQECQQSIQLWEHQHNWNLFYTKVFLYDKFVLYVAGFLILSFFIFSYFLKLFLKSKKGLRRTRKEQ